MGLFFGCYETFRYGPQHESQRVVGSFQFWPSFSTSWSMRQEELFEWCVSTMRRSSVLSLTWPKINLYVLLPLSGIFSQLWEAGVTNMEVSCWKGSARVVSAFIYRHLAPRLLSTWLAEAFLEHDHTTSCQMSYSLAGFLPKKCPKKSKVEAPSWILGTSWKWVSLAICYLPVK